ncbi:MAG TPA: molybdopterin molybdotransferase MoeA [Daejeonella sp.]|uniref:molybdopterin molybdotransferase MoeA n=1 Tax=Daejeonella sp. TaxID=2805397 RepID=UPI002ED96642
MIDVREAKNLIKDNLICERIVSLPLSEACGFILAERVLAAFDTPSFDQSAMDGYAFSHENWDGKTELTIAGEVRAGTYTPDLLKPMQTVRIFTGAPIPAGADTVVMQENVTVFGKANRINIGQITKGSNIRLRGSQTRKSEVALKEGKLLSAPAISFLAGIGIDKVRVYAKPHISIIITGKELLKPGSTISFGKIFESNSLGITAALMQLNISPVSIDFIDDIEEELIRAIKNRMGADILIVTGGISEGNYDFTAEALNKCSVEKLFHRVKQKPGKPFYFGKYLQTAVFALPGNPAAALTCFYEYIVPAIGYFTRKEYFQKLKIPLADDYKKKVGLTYFLKGKISSGTVTVLSGQESYMMNSFAMADCLIQLDEEKEQYIKGELVDVLMII